MVFVAIIILHLIFFWALKQGLVRAGIELVQDYAIMDLPPPPPPPENLDEPPPPPPVDVPPPVVPPPLIELPAFEGPSNAITAQVRETPRAQAQTPARQSQITPPSLRAKGDRIQAAIDACYPSASRRLSEEGRVVVTITVAADGKAGAATVTQSSGFPRLDQAAMDAVRKWRFVAATDGTNKIQAYTQVAVTFKLTEAEKAAAKS